MKPTVRVSIGGLAFNLEEGAYRILDNYLTSLKKHFQGNSESDEIIGDIEIRLSELLQMRIKSNDSAVSEADAQDIINIMGNPKDFDDNQDAFTSESATPKENFEYSQKNEQQEPYRKKLFRDKDNKILGGVFSGLGHYCSIDPTILRIGIVGLLLFLNFFSFRGAGTIILAYIILWIVMPAAKSFSQKLAMTGADPSIVNIEDRSQSASLKHKSSAGGCLGVFINIIAIFILTITIISIICIILGLIWLYFDTELISFPNYLSLLGFNTVNFKIATVLVTLIPLFGLLCLMVKIIRRTPFTMRTLASFTIGLIFWFGAIFYLGNYGFKFAKNHRDMAIATESISIDSIKSDTLRIKLQGDTNTIYTQPNNEGMLYKGDKMKYRQMQILPEIIVKEDSALSNFKIEIRKEAYADEMYKAEEKAKSMHLKYIQTGSLINIDPEWYDMDNPWDLQTYEIIVSAPSNKKVIIEKPLKESYRMDMEFTINNKTFRRYDYNSRRHYYFD
ncbi:MAG: PspC domain-containing protein [Prevotella sp.]|jgi:phage shock protein PspC (stress-responsive transcriptional regulator)|nr:PspC domain-containing protein [Prevotella sp.]